MSTPHGLRKSEIAQEDPEEVFEMLDIIGEGAYGLICTCKNLKQGTVYAIKFLEIEEEDEENLQKEIDILKESSDCPYIVRYFGCYMKESTLMIVMEFCDGGSCLDIMTSCKRTLTEEQISIIVNHMVQGLEYLHAHRVLHRDLKAGNVLLNSDGKAKLADFGVSAKLVNTLQKKIQSWVHRTGWPLKLLVYKKEKEKVTISRLIFGVLQLQQLNLQMVNLHCLISHL